MSALRRWVVAGLTLGLAAVGLVVAPAASAAPGDYGYLGPSYAGSVNSPTADKPQSKMWTVGDQWFANMFDTVSKTWHIFRLDRSTEQWVDTGTQVDDRPSTLADALWDGSKLYIASHVVTVSSDTSSRASQPNSPARLYRYSYDSASRTFSPDAGFPTTITTQSSESLTIDKDTTGRIWATWTQVTATSTGFTNAVYGNATSTSGTTWGTPSVLPGPGTTVEPDDISAVVAFRGRIGILWSNQLDGAVYWAVHTDGAALSSWTTGIAMQGNRLSDDHMNIKTLQSDAAGRVYAAVKTSLDGASTSASTDPQIMLLRFTPSTSTWSSTTFGTLADCHTRPLVMLDDTNQTVYVFATAPSSATGGCPNTGTPGTIYMKSAPMSSLSFTSGRGTPVIRDTASANMNDVTSSKQSVNATSGLVVMASNSVTQRYWHADLSLGGTTAAPTASFTSSATSGAGPLTVRFTDTSTGAPTSWAWDFGDGGAATEQSPSHTFTTAGTYTVKLLASNAGGTSAPVTATITVTGTTSTGGPGIAARSSTSTSNTTGASAVTLAKPAGLATGDVLIAQITADGAPSMSSVPAGWTAVLSGPLAIANGARQFVYSHPVTDGAAEPASYGFTLSSAVKWGAGVTAFSGVDTTTPFDTGSSSRTDTTYGSASVAVPGVTTVTAGAMLVGGVGLDNGTAAVTPPTGWTETFEATGGQLSELAYQPVPTAGATGTASWTLSKATASGGWLRALRPASGGGTPAQAAPTASFTSSATSGVAPLNVQFTDTSTGAPTSWAWAFGDGSTSTSTLQNPSHTFTAAGTYTVSLQATNATGTSPAATATITVTAPPPAQAAPTASFTSSATSGVAPLDVQFTDTSTGTPTSWAWAFGDGSTSTSTLQNPSHTFTAAGTYTVSLQATNATGTSAPATATITVTAPPPTGGTGGTGIAARSSSSTSSTAAVTAVTLAKPAGVAAGDVLVAQITADGAPSMSAVPAGWTAVLSAPIALGSNARVFVYSHVVGTAAEPASYGFTLSTAVKWGAGVTAFSGVNTTTPFDTAATTKTDTSYASTSVAVPGVTTVTNGAMLIGGVGLDSGSSAVTPPTGWTEPWEATGAQEAELAYRSAPTAGATGTVTWTLSKATAWAGWLRALRPAA